MSNQQVYHAINQEPTICCVSINNKKKVKILSSVFLLIFIGLLIGINLTIKKIHKMNEENRVIEYLNTHLEERYFETRTYRNLHMENTTTCEIENCHNQTNIPKEQCDKIDPFCWKDTKQTCSKGHQQCDIVVHYNHAIRGCLANYYMVDNIFYWVHNGAWCYYCLNTETKCIDMIYEQSKRWDSPTFYDIQNPNIHSFKRETFIQSIIYSQDDFLRYKLFMGILSFFTLVTLYYIYKTVKFYRDVQPLPL